MPTAFSADERERIEAALLEAGAEQFARFGIRRTNVADLAQAAGIGKGSFYLFFSSKEDLFLSVVDRVEKQVKADLLRELDGLSDDPRAMLTRFWTYMLEVLQRHPLLSLLSQPGEMERLQRKASPERLAANVAEDDAFFGGLLEAWRSDGIDLVVEPDVLNGLVRLMLGISRQRDLVGEEVFDRVTATVVESLVDRLLKEGS